MATPAAWRRPSGRRRLRLWKGGDALDQDCKDIKATIYGRNWNHLKVDPEPGSWMLLDKPGLITVETPEPPRNKPKVRLLLEDGGYIEINSYMRCHKGIAWALRRYGMPDSALLRFALSPYAAEEGREELCCEMHLVFPHRVATEAARGPEEAAKAPEQQRKD